MDLRWKKKKNKNTCSHFSKSDRWVLTGPCPVIWLCGSGGREAGIEVCHEQEHHCQRRASKRKWRCPELQNAKVWPWCWNHLITGFWTPVELLILHKWDKGVILQANLKVLLISSGLFVRRWTFPSSSHMLETCSPRRAKFLPILCFLFPCLPLKIPLLKGNLDFKAVDLML